MASSRLVLPLPLSPWRRLMRGEGWSVTGCRLRTPVTERRRKDIEWSETHRHDHVRRIVVVGLMDQRAAVGVRKDQTELLAANHTQDIQQITDVEADLEIAAVVLDCDFLFRFFLLGVVGLNFQQ